MNTTFTINLDATELVGALNNLAAGLKKRGHTACGGGCA